MASLSLREAAEQAGTSKSTIWRAIKAGRMSATRTDDGGFAIDPAELFRAFPPERPRERFLGQGATPSAATAEQPATAETARPDDLAVKLAAAVAELAGLRALLAEVRANRDELRASRDELQEDRDAWLASAGERAGKRHSLRFPARGRNYQP